jgi:uncharacterized protein (DUF934 family)
VSEPSPLLAPIKPALTAARLWSATGFVADAWQPIADDAGLPLAGRAIVSLARWRRDQAVLLDHGQPVGIAVGSAETIDAATDNIAALALIALDFPKFTDGRAYSTAKRLREAGYRGELRATGDVLLDQLPLMLQSGFDTFEITNAATLSILDRQPSPLILPSYQRRARPVSAPATPSAPALRRA